MSSKKIPGTGFNSPPGNDPKRTALSWHYYCWLIDLDHMKPLINGSYPDFVHAICDDWQLNDYFDVVEEDMVKLGGTASFMTEFGMCDFPVPGTNNEIWNQDMCQFILDKGDDHFMSWTYWDCNFYLDNQQVNYFKLDLFARVYPFATNGVPQIYMYNATTRYFLYVYKTNITSIDKADLATEIFIPLHLYPNSFVVTVSSNLKYTFDQDSSKLYVYLADEIKQKLASNKFKFYDSQAIVTIQAK
jgi:hypothetical protein